MTDQPVVLIQTYRHDCGRCSRAGQTFTYRPEVRDGVVLGVTPTCLETRVQLVLVSEVER